VTRPYLRTMLRGVVPRSLRERIFVLRIMGRDLLYRVTRRRPEFMAPLLLSYRFGIYDLSTFEKVGRDFREHLVGAGLGHGDRILEIGSGTGRMAAALLPHLTGGTYTGLEINHRAIEWCRRYIAVKNAACSFVHADVRNAFYNPTGAHTAATYRLPFASESFDFVFLTSVFTHMKLEEIENYLREIRRVVREGGRCFATWFLLDDDNRRAILEGKSRMSFVRDFGGGLTVNAEVPEEAVAFARADVERLYKRCGLLMLDVKPGAWSAIRPGPNFQDIILAAAPTR